MNLGNWEHICLPPLGIVDCFPPLLCVYSVLLHVLLGVSSVYSGFLPRSKTVG